MADHSFNKGTCGVCGAADPDYRPPVNPETGDRAPIALLAAMAVLSMLSAAVVIRKKEF